MNVRSCWLPMWRGLVRQDQSRFRGTPGLQMMGMLIGATALVAGCVTPADARSAQANSANEEVIAAADLYDDGRFDYFDGLVFDAAVPSPKSFFGHAPGEHFVRHGEMVRYLDALDEATDRVTVQQYGQSHQRRSLHLITISSEENLERLDDVLAANRELAQRDLSDERRDEIVENNPAIAWLSYTVHGNEGSTVNTALQVAYTLAAATNGEVAEILDDVVVVIDPLLNPDGYMRYVTWYENARAISGPDASLDAAERFEPWPGGRSNHYLFDLNRDWLWQVHPESRSRIAVYREYLPHLHIDYHEQGFRNPYFLGGGDTPYSLNIPEESRRWIEKYGDANAEVFDSRGLQYSSKERFDYLYPGYGKVLPVYHGAIGMLAEQAGHSRSGQAIEVDDRYTLTLAERVNNHFLLSMSNVETTARQRRGQLERFRRFFADACEPDEYDTAAFIIDADNDPAMLEKVFELLTSHGIEIDELAEDVTVPDAKEYRSGESSGTVDVPAGSWLVRPDQPMGRLVKTLFEREPEIEDPDTYDITSWSVPVAFGLKAYWTSVPFEAETQSLDSWAAREPAITGVRGVALIVDAEQYRFPQAVGLIGELEMTARVAGERFSVDGRTFHAGSLIVHEGRNDPDVLERFEDALLDLGLSGHRAGTGMTDDGPVLGANSNRWLDPPNVMLLRDSPISSLSYGQIWHLLDLEMPVPYTAVNVGDVRRADLDSYNVIVVPHGRRLSGALGSSTVEDINDWVRSGGTLVAVGGGAGWANSAILDLDEADENDEESEERPPQSELTWEQRQDRRVEDRIPGATLSAAIDATHPFAAGAGEWVGIIKRGGRTIPVRDSGAVVARFDESPRVAGAISERNARRIGGTPYMTHHSHGRGNVICLADDPTLRGFQHHPTRLLLNAIIYGPTF